MEEARKYTSRGEDYSEREIRLIRNCISYEEDDPAGLPGHNLMILIAKFTRSYPIIEDIEDASWDWS